MAGPGKGRTFPGWTLAGGSVGATRGLTEEPADGHHGLEEGWGEAGTEAQRPAVGQPPQDDGRCWGPKKRRASGRIRVVQRPVGLQQPLPFLFHQMAWSDQSCLRSVGPQAKGDHVRLGRPLSQR